MKDLACATQCSQALHARSLARLERTPGLRDDLALQELDKLRPVIILSVDALNKFALDACVVPVTTKQHAQFSMRVPLKAKDGGLQHDCWAKCDQITTRNRLPASCLSKPRLFLAVEQLEDHAVAIESVFGSGAENVAGTIKGDTTIRCTSVLSVKRNRLECLSA